MSIGYVTPKVNNQPSDMCFNLKYVPLCGVQRQPTWGFTLYYFLRMCMFECIPFQTFERFS